jgi:hypothetical protein
MKEINALHYGFIIPILSSQVCVFMRRAKQLFLKVDNVLFSQEIPVEIYSNYF